MTGQKEYYAEDLEKLRKRVDKCSLETLDSLEFFLKEADAHMAGISDDIMKEIHSEIDTFKKLCHCEKRYP